MTEQSATSIPEPAPSRPTGRDHARIALAANLAIAVFALVASLVLCRWHDRVTAAQEELRPGSFWFVHATQLALPLLTIVAIVLAIVSRRPRRTAWLLLVAQGVVAIGGSYALIAETLFSDLDVVAYARSPDGRREAWCYPHLLGDAVYTAPFGARVGDFAFGFANPCRAPCRVELVWSRDSSSVGVRRSDGVPIEGGDALLTPLMRAVISH